MFFWSTAVDKRSAYCVTWVAISEVIIFRSIIQHVFIIFLFPCNLHSARISFLLTRRILYGHGILIIVIILPNYCGYIVTREAICQTVSKSRRSKAIKNNNRIYIHYTRTIAIYVIVLGGSARASISSRGTRRLMRWVHYVAPVIQIVSARLR